MHTSIVRPIAFVSLFALTLVAASAAPAPAQVQSKGQQKCINKLNKAGAKLCKTQGKEVVYYKNRLYRPGRWKAAPVADVDGPAGRFAHQRLNSLDREQVGKQPGPEYRGAALCSAGHARRTHRRRGAPAVTRRACSAPGRAFRVYDLLVSTDG